MATSVIQIPGLRIKSVQRGIITTASANATASITSVDTSKSIINSLGNYDCSTAKPTSWLTLTDGTTVTAYFVGAAAGNSHSFEVVEFY